jgi:pimeloyl-ACP methyl ester carboxylesterase
MPALATECKTLAWPVEPGSDLEVPIKYATNTMVFESEKPVILWSVGFGEGLPAAEKAAQKLGEVSGLQSIGIVPPFVDVTRKASNMAQGLDRLVAGLPHYVARQLALQDRPVYFGGNSRGGAVALLACTTGGDGDRCDAIGALSPLAVTNTAFGDTAFARRRALAVRLGLETTRQQEFFNTGNMRVLGGVLSELGSLTLRGRLVAGLDYALSDELAERTHESLVQFTDEGHPAAIFAAEEDRCFTRRDFTELLQGIDRANVLRQVPYWHAGMESQQGQEQLAVVGKWFAAPVLFSAAG